MCEVTVVLASYNVGKYIEQSLLSALNQDFDDYEVLICDDCSTDDTLDIAKRIIQEHPKGNKVRIDRGEKNQGTAVIRNNGIDHSRGKFLLYLDGDDYLPENAISILYAKMQETNADVVTGNHYRFNDEDDGSIVNSTRRAQYTTQFKSFFIESPFAIAEWMKSRNSDYYPVATWNKLFRKSFLIDNNIRCVPSHHVIDDIYFAFQTTVKATRFAVVDDVTLFWRQRNGSATHVNVKKDRMDIYVDIFETIMRDMKTLTDGGKRKVPVQLYNTLINKYVSGFVTINILNSTLLTISQKQDYLDHIRAITKTGLTRKDMIGKVNKILFTLLSFKHNYWLMKAAIKVVYHIR